MTDEITTRTELLLAMDREWEALERLLEHTSDRELTGKTDAKGWSSKDHLAHLATWGESVVRMIRDGVPRWEGLGLNRELYEAPGWDEKNEEIRQRSQVDTLEEVRAHLDNVHHDMRRIVDGMGDAELLRPLAEVADGGKGETIMRRVLGSFPWHYAEHREYIERILATSGDSRAS